jgi:secondary thiamine-phosphate synthase enzyme
MLTLSLQTPRRVVFVDITDDVGRACRELALADGALFVFVPHTTAGLTINENADPSVRADMEMTLERIAPRDLAYTHREGNADAHVKASLMGSSVTVPVVGGRLRLGTWQGIYFAEFDGPRRRQVHVVALPAHAA